METGLYYSSPPLLNPPPQSFLRASRFPKGRLFWGDRTELGWAGCGPRQVGGGESCSCVTDRGYFGKESGGPNGTGHVGPYNYGDSKVNLFECIRQSWVDVATKDYVYGNFAWTGFDYRGEACRSPRLPPLCLSLMVSKSKHQVIESRLLIFE